MTLQYKFIDFIQVNSFYINILDVVFLMSFVRWMHLPVQPNQVLIVSYSCSPDVVLQKYLFCDPSMSGCNFLPRMKVIWIWNSRHHEDNHHVSYIPFLIYILCCSFALLIKMSYWSFFYHIISVSWHWSQHEMFLYWNLKLVTSFTSLASIMIVSHACGITSLSCKANKKIINCMTKF